MTITEDIRRAAIALLEREHGAGMVTGAMIQAELTRLAGAR